MALKVGERKKPERICRNISLPAVSTVTDPPGQGAIPIEDAVSGQHDRAAFTHVIFEPVDFIAKLVQLGSFALAVTPRPRVNLTGPP